MLIFVVGPSGAGKTTVAGQLVRAVTQAGVQACLVEAGAWARKLTPERPDEDSASHRARMTAGAVRQLRADPRTAVDWVRANTAGYAVGVVAGVRNPLDFGQLYTPGRDLAVVIDGECSGFDAGVRVIRDMLGWLHRTGIGKPAMRVGAQTALHDDDVGAVVRRARTAWLADRHFAVLPAPIRATVDNYWLSGRDQSARGHTAGALVAVEAYPGEVPTGMFLSDGGGCFHDLPIDAFLAADRVGHLRRVPAPAAYGLADVGPVVVEPAPVVGPWTVFDRDRRPAGTGTSVAVVHWPRGNTLYHVIVTGVRVLLWPPHKLLLGAGRRDLPAWKKL